MGTTDSSSYTAVCLMSGIAISAALRILAADPIEAWLGPLYFTIDHWESGVFDRFVLVTFLGLVGLGVLWLSSRLDFVDQRDDLFPVFIIAVAIFAVCCWLLFMLFSWTQHTSYGDGARPAQWGNDTFFQHIGRAIAGLIGLVLLLPFWLFWVLYPIVILGAFLGGVLCVPRAFVFAVTRHSLRDTWEKGRRRGQFDSHEVTAGLGQSSKSSAQGRATLKESLSLLEEARAELGRLKTESDQLSKSI